MKLSEIPKPNCFSTVWKERTVEILVPSVECFHQLMQQLESVGWTWNGAKPTKVQAFYLDRQNHNFVQLWKKGYITCSSCKITKDLLVNIEWNSIVEQSNLFCSCVSPQVVKQIAGIGNGGKSFDFCQICKKERQ